MAWSSVTRCCSVLLGAEVSVRHYSTNADMSGQFGTGAVVSYEHFGTGAVVSYEHFGTSAEMFPVRSIMTRSDVDNIHQVYIHPPIFRLSRGV